MPRREEHVNLACLWDEYWTDDSLESWQRLCRDVGLEDDFPSKTQCRKALAGVWVNIVDFLQAASRPDDVRRFDSQRELAGYTRKWRKFFPRTKIPKGSPLRCLLAQIT